MAKCIRWVVLILNEATVGFGLGFWLRTQEVMAEVEEANSQGLESLLLFSSRLFSNVEKCPDLHLGHLADNSQTMVSVYSIGYKPLEVNHVRFRGGFLHGSWSLPYRRSWFLAIASISPSLSLKCRKWTRNLETLRSAFPPRI